MDIAAFKTLKHLWKKSVLEWKQENPTQMLPLDRVAPLLLLKLLLKNYYLIITLLKTALKHVDYILGIQMQLTNAIY